MYNLTNLIYLNISYNQIHSISNSIINCKKLKEFIFNNNKIKNNSPTIIRFLILLRKNLQVYNDNENVMTHSIKESVRNSIIKIINQKYILNIEDIINDIINDNILTVKTKQLLFKYNR